MKIGHLSELQRELSVVIKLSNCHSSITVTVVFKALFEFECMVVGFIKLNI